MFIVWLDWEILAQLVLIGITAILMNVAVLMWFIKRHLNSQPGQAVIEKNSSQLTELKKMHSNIYLPFTCWAIIIGLATSIAILFLKA